MTLLAAIGILSFPARFPAVLMACLAAVFRQL